MNSKNLRNFCFGRTLHWAGEQAIRREAERRGGRYSWRHTTLQRWKSFCFYCRSNRVNDARYVYADLIQGYARSIWHLASATQQNYISSINAVMKLLAGEDWESVSHSGITKSKRSNVKICRLDIGSSNFKNACDEITETLGKQFEFAVRFAYTFGLRRREALLLEFHLAYKQALNTDAIDIIRGTKGGRSRAVARIIPVPCSGYELLRSVCGTYPHARCLLVSNSYKTISTKLSNSVLPILKRHGINRFHDLRADYAIFRYKKLTGIDAPRNTLERASKEKDTAAREIISHELGHSRTNILNSYVGSFSEKANSN